jgi:hypothetical protein
MDAGRQWIPAGAQMEQAAAIERPAGKVHEGAGHDTEQQMQGKRAAAAQRAAVADERLEHRAGTSLRAVHYKDRVLWHRGGPAGVQPGPGKGPPTSSAAAREETLPRTRSRSGMDRAPSSSADCSEEGPNSKTIWTDMDKAKYISVLQHFGRDMKQLRSALPDKYAIVISRSFLPLCVSLSEDSITAA